MEGTTKMRIISQDEMIDMPYEQVIVGIDYRAKDRIIANGVNLESDSIVMAKYSDESKAIKAMEILRKKYRNSKAVEHRNVYFIFPKDEEL